MNIRLFGFFLRRNLRRRPGRTLTAVGAIALGIAIFHIVAALALALHSQVLERIEAIFPERTVLVRSRALELGPIAISAALLTPQITPEAVAKIEALEGVETVWPLLPIRFPLMAVGSLVGYEGATDVIAYGVPRGLVANDIRSPRGWSYKDPATTTVPVIVSRFFIDMFNLGMAESQNLPRLTDSFVIGKEFDLLLGASLLTLDTEESDSQIRKVDCVIVGLSRDPSLLGLVMPIEYVREFNRRYLGPQATEKFSQVHVVLRSPGAYDNVVAKIEAMGFEVAGRREMAQRLRFAATGGMVVLLLFGLAVLAMAIISIANTFALIMLERRDEIGLFRAVGATRRTAMGLLLAESLAIGLAGGLLGAGVAWAASALLNGALLAWIPPFSLAPDYWLDTRVSLFMFNVLLATLASLAATAPLVRRSVRQWPARLLRAS